MAADPQHLRQTLDDLHRQLADAEHLDPQMTALYATELGTLYLTRNAVPQDGNSTYNHVQYGSRLQWPGGGNAGTNLHRNVEAQPWQLLQGGSPASSTVAYKGFDLSGEGLNTVTLKHNIVAGAAVIEIRETPEYANVGGNPGLQRSIQVTGLAEGQSLRLHLSGAVRPETWTLTSGSGTLSGSEPVYLDITADGTTVVTGSWQP